MWHTRQLILHGGIVLLVGLLSGAGFGSAISRGKSEATVRAWRVAHSGIVMGGVLLLALAPVMPYLRLGAAALTTLVWSLVSSSYAFAIVLPLGAHYGHRGLSGAPPFLNRVVYAGNILGAAGSLIGTLLLVWGAYAAL
jgi:hypothetical protein